MRIVIIGGDAAGMSAASQIKRWQPEWEVVVFEKGEYTSYAACGIPYYLAGDVAEFDDLVVVTPEQFRKRRGIDVRMGCEVVAIDTAARTVRATSAGESGAETVTESYDRLLIATGASAIVPPWPGVGLEGVLALRNLTDTRRMEALLEGGARRAVIVGAGYIGLEMAEAFSRRGLEVTVVEKLAGVMGGVEAKITEMVAAELAEHGVELRLETTVEGFVAAGEGDSAPGGTESAGGAGSRPLAGSRLGAVKTDQGEIEADIAVVALGVRPNVGLAREAGVALGDTGAIRVDERQRTSAENVFAAGDCAEAYHRVLERPAYVPLALGANRQGRVAGANMAGGADRFPGIVGSAVTRVFELSLSRTGIDAAAAEAAGIPCRSAAASGPSRAHYFPGHDPLWVKLFFRSDDHRLLGAWLVGRDPAAGKRGDILATALSAGMTVLEVADLDLSYAPPFAPVWDPVLKAANRARFQLEKQ